MEKNIYQKLIEVMKEVRYIQKEDKTVNNQYRFVSHDAVTSACSEAFIKHGIYAQPKILSNKIELITTQKYNKYEKRDVTENNFICQVEIEYTFINIDNPAEKVTVNGIGQGIDPQDKACGKAISYACKYALLKALGIETGDDPEKDVDYKVEAKTNHNKLANIADGLGEDMGDLVKQNKLDKANEFLKKIKIELEAASSVEKINEICEKNKKLLASLEENYSDLFEVFKDCKEGMIQILGEKE